MKKFFILGLCLNASLCLSTHTMAADDSNLPSAKLSKQESSFSTGKWLGCRFYQLWNGPIEDNWQSSIGFDVYIPWRVVDFGLNSGLSVLYRNDATIKKYHLPDDERLLGLVGFFDFSVLFTPVKFKLAPRFGLGVIASIGSAVPPDEPADTETTYEGCLLCEGGLESNSEVKNEEMIGVASIYATVGFMWKISDKFQITSDFRYRFLLSNVDNNHGPLFTVAFLFR